MFIEAISISIILGLIRGGKLRRFKDLNHKTIWLFMLGVLIQYILAFLSKVEELEGLRKVLEYNKQLQVISFILILIGIVTNIRLRSFWIILIGYALNFIVLISNGWIMPDLLSNAILENIKFPFLGNTVLFSEHYPIPRTISMGDLVIGFGIFALIQEIMLEDDPFMGKYKL